MEIIDTKSSRAVKAKFAQRLTKLVRGILTLVAVSLALAGIGLLIINLSAGWVLIGLAALPILPLEWFRGELSNIPPEDAVIKKGTSESTSIISRLDSVILGKLSANPSPAELALVLGGQNDAQFFGARFGLTASLLQDVASAERISSKAIFEEAETIRRQLVMSTLSSGMLIAGLIKQFPNYEALLGHLHIKYEDILEGIRWQARLKALIASQKAPKRTGGIARDWSFGYAPLLARFGQNISQTASSSLIVEVASHQKALDQLIDTFSGGGRQNTAIIAPTGAGKTTLVDAFAAKLLEAKSNISSKLKFRQIIMLDASALIAAAPGRGELENLLDHVLSEAYVAKNIIIYLDNAQLFFEEGLGSVDVSNLLLPILETGRLRIILSMDEQRYLQITQRNSSVANALNRINLAPTARQETIEILENQLIITEFGRKVTFSYQSLVEAQRLSERYIHDVAMPGQAIKLLELAAGYSESGLVTINSVQQAIEQTMNIKVSVASELNDRETLLHLEDLIHKRMINQTRAVSVVSDALRRARAGVRNPDRPIGTFLFLGPTGVGKTELAKALAATYFDGEEQIIRLDLNEYVRSEDVTRLIADGAADSSSLTAQASKKPFSVVLLDEIEKAHPNVLATLLQLLDEGILRDINNREISFRDAIVIATSNAGADRIREYIQRGYKLEQFEQQFVDELISSNQFRPEFLNRFDEIVTFTPLGKAELLQVIDLMIAGVNKTLALQSVSVHVNDDAKSYLVDAGYDPRLGARPMRRIVQRAVENTVAKLMLAGSVEPGSEIVITLEQVSQLVGSQRSAEQLANGQDSPVPS